MFQSENESNEEDYTRSPVLLDLDENSKQQQRKAASREVSSSSSTVNQQDQGLIPGAWIILNSLDIKSISENYLCLSCMS